MQSFSKQKSYRFRTLNSLFEENGGHANFCPKSVLNLSGQLYSLCLFNYSCNNSFLGLLDLLFYFVGEQSTYCTSYVCWHYRWADTVCYQPVYNFGTTFGIMLESNIHQESIFLFEFMTHIHREYSLCSGTVATLSATNPAKSMSFKEALLCRSNMQFLRKKTMQATGTTLVRLVYLGERNTKQQSMCFVQGY